LSWKRANDLLISALVIPRLELFADELFSFSIRLWLAAIQRSNQLHPQAGLVGSVNNGFIDFDEFLPFFCQIQVHIYLRSNST
jgi:hypothetical protein